ncbi:hypothetical protein GCM10011529_23950 [Polymorphobacter glacialis]|uniref:Uncharacterized protein n=1 Tax=Sandarakinorhabdus glacialis TaxID=1614636 RepID=A0A917E973_9SPHN|nr:hypothetical protein [Polymorphobacter glacialis]GGE16702.1 hypothetical protein GCM10011529_23950 [Polymorphobacter glacialis]
MTKPRPRSIRVIRPDGWTVPRQRLFLKMLAVTGSVDKSCAEANMSVSSAYRLRLHPDGQAFRDGWAQALAASTLLLRELAFDRALNGTREAIRENGEIVGHRTVFNERLLIFLLKRYDHQSWGVPHENLVNSLGRLQPSDVPEAEFVEHELPKDEPERESGFASQ